MERKYLGLDGFELKVMDEKRALLLVKMTNKFQKFQRNG